MLEEGGEMALLESVDELRALLADRPTQTVTYRVDAAIGAEVNGLMRSVSADSGRPIRLMTAAERGELANYLGMPAGELYEDMAVSDFACTGCGRLLTMLDFAKTSIDRGIHTKSALASVLSGRAGHWVTVDGTDGGRPVRCAACGRAYPASGFIYDCPTGGYAHG